MAEDTNNVSYIYLHSIFWRMSTRLSTFYFGQHLSSVSTSSQLLPTGAQSKFTRAGMRREIFRVNKLGGSSGRGRGNTLYKLLPYLNKAQAEILSLWHTFMRFKFGSCPTEGRGKVLIRCREFFVRKRCLYCAGSLWPAEKNFMRIMILWFCFSKFYIKPVKLNVKTKKADYGRAYDVGGTN